MRKSKNVCPTRWVDGHSAIVRFVGLLRPVFDALEDLSTESGNTGSQVTMLLRSISSCELLVSLHVMEDMCGLLLPLSKHGPLYDSTWTGSSGCRPTRLIPHVAYSSSGLSCRSCSIPSLSASCVSRSAYCSGYCWRYFQTVLRCRCASSTFRFMHLFFVNVL